MRFFVPASSDLHEAEARYQQMRQRLSQTVEPLGDRRLCRVRFEDDGRVLTLAVGDSFRRQGGEPVLAILEGDGSFWICTAHHGGTAGEPYRVPKEAVQDLEEFTALA